MLKLTRSTTKDMTYGELLTLRGRLENKSVIQELNGESVSRVRHDLRVVNSEIAAREEQKTVLKSRLLQ
jgi:hypothetical protein